MAIFSSLVWAKHADPVAEECMNRQVVLLPRGSDRAGRAAGMRIEEYGRNLPRRGRVGVAPGRYVIPPVSGIRSSRTANTDATLVNVRCSHFYLSKYSLHLIDIISPVTRIRTLGLCIPVSCFRGATKTQLNAYQVVGGHMFDEHQCFRGFPEEKLCMLATLRANTLSQDANPLCTALWNPTPVPLAPLYRLSVLRNFGARSSHQFRSRAHTVETNRFLFPAGHREPANGKEDTSC
jgi:hypothetical protein